MSNENYNPEIYELLSAYIDNELSDNQLEKVSQLLREDPQAREIVESLQASSQAVRSLPREYVPRDLTDEVLYALERDTLLDGNDDLAVEAGERHLRFRNFIGAAAIMILVGAVFVVVYNILVPGGEINEEAVTTEKFEADNETGNTDNSPLFANNNTETTVPTFRSLGEAASALSGKQSPYNSETNLSQMLDDEYQSRNDYDPLSDITEPLPQLPPIMPFEAPEPRYSHIKLVSKTTNLDNSIKDNLANLLNSSVGDYLFAENGNGTLTFAFVCTPEKFADICYELNMVLPAEPDLELRNINGFDAVKIVSLNTNDIIALAKFESNDQQLDYAKRHFADSQISYIVKNKGPQKLLWEQIANIVPGQYQSALSSSLKTRFETLEIETKLDHSILDRYESSRTSPTIAAASTASDSNNIASLDPAPAGRSMMARQMRVTQTESAPATARTFIANAASPSISDTVATDTVAENITPSPAPEQLQEKVDFVAVEIIISPETSSLPQTEPLSGPALPDKLPNSGTRFNFGF